MQVNIQHVIDGVLVEISGGKPGEEQLGEEIREEETNEGADKDGERNGAQARAVLVVDALGNALQLGEEDDKQLVGVHAVELDDLDEHQFEELGAGFKRADHTPHGVAQDAFDVLAGGLLYGRDYLIEGVVCQEDGFEKVFFAGEVVVETSEGDASILGDLAHGGAVVPVLHEELVGDLDDFLAGVLAAGRAGLDHGFCVF